MTYFTKPLTVFFLYQVVIPCIMGLQFNPNYTGVVFSAYVRKVTSTGPNPNQDWERYSLEDVKTMLEVISGKFSKVVTFGVGTRGPYKENITYNQSYSQVFSAEAAALINQENNSSTLSMVIGMWVSKSSSQMHSEVKVAFESAKKANDRFPGTVWGLIFCENNIADDFSLASMTLKKLEKIKVDAENLNLKLGTRQKCDGILGDAEDNGPNALRDVRQKIVNLTDFIICRVDSSTKEQLPDYRESFKTINPKIEVMGETGTSSTASSRDEISYFKKYWKMIDTWAEDNNITMWMDEAFDNPWNDGSPYMGWWRLESNDQVGNASGYLEKISNAKKNGKSTITAQNATTTASNNEPPGMDPVTKRNESGTGVWTYVGIAIGIIVAVIVIVQLSLLFRRFNRLRDVFTKEEVRIFLYGASEETALRNAETENGQIETAALARPYDRSYEISKDNLKIDWQCPLGSGEFGCVFKSSLITPTEGKVEIALKLAKQDCPKNALKSLLSEIKILTYLGKHTHLVSIKGAYTAEIQRGIVYVGTELCQLGSLKGYLRNNQSTSNSKKTNAYDNVVGKGDGEIDYMNLEMQITFREMVQWAYEIACGMEYLGSKHVIHADLATRNVLLTSEKVAKITDFGLSRRLYDYTNYVKTQQEPLPWRWMSIEALKKLEFSSQSDVWSYGVTLWEIFSMGDVPYPGLSWTVDFVICLENGLRMQQPPHASSDIFNIMGKCWEKEPHDRPTFTQLKLYIDKILESNKKF